MNVTARALEGYATAAPALIAQYDGVSPARLYDRVGDLLPRLPARVLDVGAGNGRDAAWFAQMGHTVTAVEPVDALATAIAARHPAIRTLCDRLPALDGMRDRFDLIAVNAVWQHLDVDDRHRSITRLFALLAPSGRLILSCRNGPGHPARPVVPIDVDGDVAQADATGLRLLRRCDAPSRQRGNVASGVTWTWLVFERGATA